MAAVYIIRKNDTYYFRQCLSQSARNRFNKYEFLKSLRVSKRKDALVLSRELKIAFDQIFNKAMKKHSVTWKQIRDAVNEAFEIIFQKFVKSVNDYGRSDVSAARISSSMILLRNDPMLLTSSFRYATMLP